MQYSYIKRTLNRININFDEQTINNVVQFLQNQIGPVLNQEQQYHIYAASAIVSECSSTPNVNNSISVGNGIRIENIMRHLPGLSKQHFLEIASFQVNKWNKAPAWLLPRIKSLVISYRIFKKYKAVFYNLAEELKLNKQLVNNLSPLFWIIYLFVKNKQNDPTNDHQNTLILSIMLKYIFNTLVGQLQPKIIATITQAEFKQLQAPSSQKQKYYYEKFHQILQDIYTKRLCKPYSFNHIIEHPIVLQRLTDDISNNYNNFFNQLPKWFIDQMTYLELTKTLTPQIFCKSMPDVQPISNAINFDEQDDQQNEAIEQQKNIPPPKQQEIKQEKKNCFFSSFKPLSSPLSPVSPTFHYPKPQFPVAPIKYSLITTLSPFRPPLKDQVNAQKHAYQATPVTRKLQNMRWIRDCLSLINDKHYQQISQYYKKFRNDTFEDYKFRVYNRISNAIDQFDVDCIDKPKRQAQMFKLFVYVLSEISKAYSEPENQAIFDKDQSLNSLLCLSVQLFNFSYKTLRQSEFVKYCQIFEVDLINAFKPINWIGKRFEQLPKGLKIHLYLVEKHILIKQMWENEIGYNLLKQNQNKNSYSNLMVINRLLKHIGERVEEICQQIKVQLKYVDKVHALMKSIITSKPQLLKFNKMDQIILLSIAFCLNQYNKKTNLEDLFKNYNNIQTSSNSYRGGMKNFQGQQFDLFDFYNEVFLPETEDILKKDHSFLSTPIRQNYQSKRNNNIRQTNPITFNFRDPSKNFFGNKKQKGQKQSYAKGLASKLRRQQNPNKLRKINEQIQSQEKQQKMQIDEVPAQIKKIFTFGQFN